ncbi:MAG: hypothetical protein AAFQ85_06735 [Pseudomonadota bacterium]
MSDQTDGQKPDPLAEEGPIDAEFEPATESTPETTAQAGGASGPGWMGVGVASLIAAGVGGLIGLSNGSGGSNGQESSALVESVDSLVESVRANENRLSGLSGEAEALDKKLSAALEGLGGAQDSEALAAVSADLQALKDRIDTAEADAPEPEGLAALVSRLDRLERADEAEAVSPRQMNRAVTVMRERVEALEAELADVKAGSERRAEALAAAAERIEAIETAPPAQAESADIDTGALTSLQEELAALRAEMESRPVAPPAETEDTPSEETEAANEAAAVAEAAAADAARRADAALALAGIESRARRGQPFQTPFAKLKAAMPDHESIPALEAIAAEGAPTLADLTASFVDAKGAAVEADATGEDDGWGWVRNVLGDAVTVRREGEAPVLADAINEAEADLEAGDLQAATSKIEALDGPGAGAFRAWLDAANNRLALEAALESLNLTMLRSDP